MAYFDGDLLSINIDCDKRQQDQLIHSIESVEAFPNDANRVRFHFKDGRIGPWFSRLWKRLTYGNVAPK